jgi:hypothetical protein
MRKKSPFTAVADSRDSDGAGAGLIVAGGLEFDSAIVFRHCLLLLRSNIRCAGNGQEGRIDSSTSSVTI